MENIPPHIICFAIQAMVFTFVISAGHYFIALWSGGFMVFELYMITKLIRNL